MKRFIAIALPVFIMLLAMSCSKDPDQSVPKINTDTIQVAYTGTADSILVETDLSLSVSVIPSGISWLRARISVKNNSQKYVVIEVDPNPDVQSRTGKVVVTATGFSHTITVIQAPFTGPHLRTDLTQVMLGGLSGSLDSFRVFANVNWMIEISPASPWLQVYTVSGNDTAIIRLATLSHLSSGSDRMATLTLKSTSDPSLTPVVITVTQKTIRFINNWSLMHGGSFLDQFNGITKTADGGTVSVGWYGYETSSTTWHSDAWVMKKDASGNTVWDKKFGGSSGEQATAVIRTSDGGYAVAGFTLSNDGDLAGLTPASADFWVMKLDASGNRTWQKIFGGSGIDIAYALVQSQDGGFVLCGYTESNNGDVTGYHGGTDVWVIKTDATGNKQWQKTLGGTLEDKGTGITLSTDGGFVIAANTKSNDGDVTGFLGGPSDGWVVKLNSSGQKTWDRTVGGTFSDEANSIFTTISGDYIVSGNTFSYVGSERGNGDVFIVKISQSGSKAWDRALGGYELDRGYSIIQSVQGYYVIGGFVSTPGGDVQNGANDGVDGWLVAIDDNENIIWEKALGGGGN